MELRRQLTFIIASVLVVLGWTYFVVPRLLPQKKPVAADQANVEKADGSADVAAGKAAAGDDSAKAAGDKPGSDAAGAEKPAAEVAAALKVPEFPPRKVTLGSPDPASGFRMEVVLSTRGASIAEIQLNDPRYVRQDRADRPLRVVGELETETLENLLTLQTSVPRFVTDISRIDWDVVGTPTENEAVFRMPSADGKLEVLKTYKLARIEPAAEANAKPSELAAYCVDVSLTLRNLSKERQSVSYTMLGPVGVPLENRDQTYKFRDVAVSFVDSAGVVSTQFYAAKTVADGKEEKWTKPFRYVGVDVQFFSALLLPVDDQTTNPYFKTVTQKLVAKLAKPQFSDLTPLLTSREFELAPAGTVPVVAADAEKPAEDAKDDTAEAVAAAKVAAESPELTHRFRLFTGPKRTDLLTALGADDVVQYGWFGSISRVMMVVLRGLHYVTGNWGFAIILLTVLTRSLMLPLSYKQMKSLSRMQELAPEIEAIKKKYENEKEKVGAAILQLYSKHGVNPMQGCLLLLPQIPIFFGLNSALQNAVELRMAPFLYMRNLAGPDAIYRLPFDIFWIGHDLNLLPILSMGLFMMQQKLFQPPAMSEEQEIQNRTMSLMTVLMGFMFYKVPSGLCLYIIVSSLWSIVERKLLPKAVSASPTTPSSGTLVSTAKTVSSSPGSSKSGPKGPQEEPPDNWFTKLVKAADKEVSAQKERKNSSGNKTSPGKRR